MPRSMTALPAIPWAALVALAALLAAGCGVTLGAFGRPAGPPPAGATPPPPSSPSAPVTDADGVTRVAVTIAGERFRLELAADPASRTRGLMGRETISPDGGMLFVFPSPDYRGFWMANCLVEIDIAFLDVNGAIVAVHEMTPEPPRRPDEPLFAYERRLPLYRSFRPAQYAIELAKGSIERLGLKPGMKIALDRRLLTDIARRNEREGRP